ncbi:MAG: hypothetical protein NUV34_02680 [Sulfuricaulis sp.]|nr:hypothetical protein [Sulfuricaulis sp.]
MGVDAEAAKYKAEGESKLITNFATGAKVKREDGTEEERNILDTEDMKEMKNLANWILANGAAPCGAAKRFNHIHSPRRSS